MKKLIAVFLCLIILSSTIVSASAIRNNSANPNIIVGDGFVIGDANDDGDVNAFDAIAIKLRCADIDNSCNGNADITGDGMINAKDLLLFKKCIIGKDSFENYKNKQNINAFEIGGYDISEFSIVYHADAKYVENNYYAADTLRKFINLATGIDLAITTEADRPHKIEFVDVTTIEGLEEKLQIENYKYEVVDGNLLIYGTRRGALYAVYEILEEYLGYRFYNETFTYQYTKRISSIDEKTTVFRKPYLEFRFSKQGFRENDEIHYFPNRLNGSMHGDSSGAFGTLTGPQLSNDHIFAYYWRMATGHVDVDYSTAKSADYEAKYSAGTIVDVSSWENHWGYCLTSDGHYATLFRGMLETMRLCQSLGHVYKDETNLQTFSICDNYDAYHCSCIECKFIMTDGNDRKFGQRLNCGEAGLNLYIANRACDDIKAFYEGRPASTDELGTGEDDFWGYGQAIYDEYPNIRILTMLYVHTAPNENILSDVKPNERNPYGYEKIRPRDNLCIMFCGNACNNHYMGSEDCNGNMNILGLSGEYDAKCLAAWGDVAKQTGATMWFRYYPVDNATYVTDSPNIFNIWHDFAYVIDNCNVTGIYCDGAANGYLFENLKAHLAAKFMWSVVENEDGTVSYMSYDEFIAEMQEYLRIHYGDGWEYVYEYICMQDEAGNVNDEITTDDYNQPIRDENGEYVYQSICYVNTCELMGDMFDYEYMNDNYEHMRDLILKGMALVEPNDFQMYQRYEFLLMNVEMIGLSAVRKAWYLSENATEEQKATYIERYDWLLNFLKNERIDGKLNGKEWNDDNLYGEFNRVIVSDDNPSNWMDQLVDLECYQYSPYSLITGDYYDKNGNGKYDSDENFRIGHETWRRYNEGWEWSSDFIVWG